MRVITGTARGRKLKEPVGMDTRPTTDRVKEGIFSSIQFEIEGRRVLDLFGGTGQMGIEALSRGAAHCTFVDLRKEATKIDPPKIIKKYGSATAKDKPLSPEEFMRLMNQGYRIGAENQIAQNEVQRCLSIIQRVIQTECDKESVNWAGVQSPILDLAFGNGGRLTRYRIHTSSGDPNLDRVVLNALSRIGSIPGLSTTFLDSVKDGILLKVKAQ